MFTPKRDTMHLRNKAFIRVGFCLVLALASFSWAQGQPGTQGQQQPGQQQQVQPTPLPSDVDPSDPALPVWLKPATPAPSAKGTPSTSGNNAPGNQTQGQGRGGEVTNGQGGGFKFHKDVEEVVLHATVIDQKQHLVTDLG